MSIYDFKIKDFRKIFREFQKTTYGRTIFFLYYFLPLLFFILFVIKSVEVVQGTAASNELVRPFLFFVFIFIVANIFYYREIRRFSEEKSKHQIKTKKKKK